MCSCPVILAAIVNNDKKEIEYRNDNDNDNERNERKSIKITHLTFIKHLSSPTPFLNLAGSPIQTSSFGLLE